jgi:hypothetical protein
MCDATTEEKKEQICVSQKILPYGLLFLRDTKMAPADLTMIKVNEVGQLS